MGRGGGGGRPALSTGLSSTAARKTLRAEITRISAIDSPARRKSLLGNLGNQLTAWETAHNTVSAGASIGRERLTQAYVRATIDQYGRATRRRR